MSRSKGNQPDYEFWSVNITRKLYSLASSRLLFVFLKKTLNEVKASGLQLSFNILQ